jgi:hypothetical protein
MPSITITTTAAEANRLQAYAVASGFTNDAAGVKALLVTLTKQGLQSFEAQQNQQTFVSSYQPIAPT